MSKGKMNGKIAMFYFNVQRLLCILYYVILCILYYIILYYIILYYIVYVCIYKVILKVSEPILRQCQ